MDLGLKPCPLSPWGSLPKGVRLLCVTTAGNPAAWLRDLFATDSAMSVVIEEAVGGNGGAARLRQQSFDIVVVRHAPPELDALEFIEAHRAGGNEEPVVVIGDEPPQEFGPLCYEVGADDYLPVEAASPRQMVWVLARAIEWRRLVRENRRLAQLERHRLQLEHGEAERLLDQQRGLISGLEELSRGTILAAEAPSNQQAAIDAAAPPAGSPLELPGSLVVRYRELLRAYVIMGSGNLAAETADLVATLRSLNLSSSRVMQLHLHALEETLHGLGSRSSRHVLSRADLLVLEVMVQLVERYRGERPA